MPKRIEVHIQADIQKYETYIVFMFNDSVNETTVLRTLLGEFNVVIEKEIFFDIGKIPDEKIAILSEWCQEILKEKEELKSQPA